MASQLENELSCIKHCLGVCEQNSIVNSIRVDSWTTEGEIVDSNGYSTTPHVQM